MKFRTLTLLPLFLLAVVSCTFRRSNPQLTEIERRLDSFPEEMWERLGEPELQQSLCSRAERMHYALLRAEAMNKTMRNMDSLRFDTINAYFQRYGDANLRMRSLYVMGSICRDEGNAPLAIQYYREAVSHADTAAADCDILTLSRIYGQMALLYEQQMLPRKALESWRAAARYADRTTDTLSSIQYRQLRSRSFEQLHELDSASYYDVQALESFTKLGIRSYVASSQSFLILPCIEEGNYPKAKQLIDEYIADSGLFDGNGRVNPYCTEFLSYLGIYYCAIGNPDSAIYYYRQRLSYTHDVTNLAMGYQGLLDAYEMKHEPDSMAKYARLYAAAKDSSNKVHAADEVIRMEATYNYAEHQRIAAEKTRETARLWRMLLCSFSVLVLLVCAVWRFRLYAKRRYQRLEAERQAAEEQKAKAWAEYKRMKKNLETMERELHEFRNEAELFVRNREEQLRHERETAKSAYEAMKANADNMEERLRNMLADKDSYIKEKEGEIQNLRDIVESFQKEYGVFDHLELHHPEESSLTQWLQQIAHKYRKITENEWLQAKMMLKAQNQDFYAYIMRCSEQLTKQELMVLVFSCLELTPSEIRVLMDITPQRTTNIRTNINTKLFNTKNSKTLVRNVFETYKMKEV